MINFQSLLYLIYWHCLTQLYTFSLYDKLFFSHFDIIFSRFSSYLTVPCVSFVETLLVPPHLSDFQMFNPSFYPPISAFGHFLFSIYFLVVSVWLMTSNIIFMLMTPKFTSSAQTSFYNFTLFQWVLCQDNYAPYSYHGDIFGRHPWGDGC